MSRIQSILMLIVCLVALQCPRAACAFPVNGLFLPDATHCDGPGLTQSQLTHEIGDGTTANPFPINEQIMISVGPYTVPPVPNNLCALDDGIANDYVIRMINTSTTDWTDLYFVADDLGQVVGNYDGQMQDLNNAAQPPTQAFRIDGTVTFGANDPLLLESGTVNEVFEQGETWDFFVLNFNGGTPSFGSVGAFGTGSLSNGASTASILANPVPEPTALGFGIAGVCSLLFRQRHQSAKTK